MGERFAHQIDKSTVEAHCPVNNLVYHHCLHFGQVCREAKVVGLPPRANLVELAEALFRTAGGHIEDHVRDLMLARIAAIMAKRAKGKPAVQATERVADEVRGGERFFKLASQLGQTDVSF